MAAKRAALTAYVDQHRDALARGERVLLFVDECFLHWGDVCGYTWGKCAERTTLAVGNPTSRQAFYGALDAGTGTLQQRAYPSVQTDNTTDFLGELQTRYPGVKRTICWDNASWHQGPLMAAYLAQVNDGCPPNEWPITCLNVAPHDPSQNPIEAVWRQGKRAIQRLRLVAAKFREVVVAFEDVRERQIFDFPKRQMYGALQIK